MQPQSYAPNHTRNDRRKEFKETSRWNEPQPSTSRHRYDSKGDYAMKRRPYDKEMDACNERQRDRNKDREKYRDRDRERERERERDRGRSQDRGRDRDREARERGRERRTSVSMRRDDRVSIKCDDHRMHQYDNNKKESRSRSRSRSRSTFSVSSRNRIQDSFNKRDTHDRSKSYESKRHRSTSRSSVKPEPMPTKPPHIDDTRISVEKTSSGDGGGGEKSERARILEKWRSNYCETSEDITRKLEELAEDNEKECWIRSSPADLYYKRASVNEIEGTSRLEALCTLFKTELVDRGPRVRKSKPLLEAQPKKRVQRVCRHKSKFINNGFILLFLAINFN